MDAKTKQELYSEAAKSFGKPSERLSNNRSMHISRYVSRSPSQKRTATPVKKKN